MSAMQNTSKPAVALMGSSNEYFASHGCASLASSARVPWQAITGITDKRAPQPKVVTKAIVASPSITDFTASVLKLLVNPSCSEPRTAMGVTQKSIEQVMNPSLERRGEPGRAPEILCLAYWPR